MPGMVERLRDNAAGALGDDERERKRAICLQKGCQRRAEKTYEAQQR